MDVDVDVDVDVDMRVIAIDPGVTGALAVVVGKPGDLRVESVADLPVLVRHTATGKARRSVDGVALADMVRDAGAADGHPDSLAKRARLGRRQADGVDDRLVEPAVEGRREGPGVLGLRADEEAHLVLLVDQLGRGVVPDDGPAPDASCPRTAAARPEEGML